MLSVHMLGIFLFDIYTGIPVLLFHALVQPRKACRDNEINKVIIVMGLCILPALFCCSHYGAKFEKSEKFWTKLYYFFFMLADWNGYFWANLNESVQYFDAKQKCCSLETKLCGKNWIELFLNLQYLWANFLLKFMYGQFHTC